MNLQQAFDALRQQEAASAPRFDRMRRARAPRSLAPRLAFAAMVLITVAVIVFRPQKPQPSITAWKAPTDFLLQTPGRELLTSVPDLKGSPQ
jgi:negative regulator of sigma E activity